MLIIEYLKKNGKDKLYDEHGVVIRDYPAENIMVLNYSPLANKNNPLAAECRSLILEREYPYNPISRSFNRFFNLFEEVDINNKQINFHKSIAWEKMDGSIIHFYWFDNKWCCATSSMAFAEGQNMCGFYFNELVDDLIKKIYPFLLNSFDKNNTYIFELISIKNRIVKKYYDDRLVLLAVRNILTGKEFSFDELKDFSIKNNIELPQFHTVDSLNIIQEQFLPACEELDEGFVLADYSDLYNVHRIKFKNKTYLEFAYKFNINQLLIPKNIIKLMWSNEYQECLSVFPEYKTIFDPYIDAYNNILLDIECFKKYIKEIPDQKEFAFKIKNLTIACILFQLRNGFLLEQIIENMLDSIKIKIFKTYLIKGRIITS